MWRRVLQATFVTLVLFALCLEAHSSTVWQYSYRTLVYPNHGDGVTVDIEARDSSDAAISSNRLQTLNIGETTRTRLDSYRKAS